MDHFTRGFLVERGTGITNPVSKAVAAKACQAHEVDILGIVAMAQMAHQPSKCGSGDGIVEAFQGICGVRIRIFRTAHGHTLGFSALLCHRGHN
jgi:hypothetical protein